MGHRKVSQCFLVSDTLLPFFSLPAVGAILDHAGGWPIVLASVALLNFVSAAIYLLFATSEPLFD